MIGDDAAKIDFNDFLSELQNELPGVEVKRGSALHNLESEFVQFFKSKLDEAFDRATSAVLTVLN